MRAILPSAGSSDKGNLPPIRAQAWAGEGGSRTSSRGRGRNRTARRSARRSAAATGRDRPYYPSGKAPRGAARLRIRLTAEEARDLPGAALLDVAQLLAADRQDRFGRGVADLAGGRRHLDERRRDRVGG